MLNIVIVILAKLNRSTQDSTTANDVSYPIVCVCVYVCVRVGGCARMCVW